MGTLLYEDLDYVNGVGADYPYIINFQNETPFKYYRTQYISNSNNNISNLISIYEIYYSEGVETTIKDSTVTTNNIVLSNNTAGTTSDDIVVRDSSGNLKTISNSMPTNNNQLINGAGYITSANGGNAQTLDSIDSTAFINETHTKQQAPNDLTPGWYTVAIVPIGRATGRFALRDQQGSARHQSTTFYASHIFGNDRGTQLTVLNNNSYSNRRSHIRWCSITSVCS